MSGTDPWPYRFGQCAIYSITTNQEAIRALFRVINRCVGKFAAYAARVFTRLFSPAVGP
jgi:hypothetical protein